MGSKNLKAIAVKWRKPIQIYDVRSLLRVAKESYKTLLEDETIKARKCWGTARVLLFANDLDLLPIRNFREATFEGAENISTETLEKRFWVKHKSCHGCPVNCGKLGLVKAEKYAKVEGAEYERLFGSNRGVKNHEAIAYANMLCDRLGLNTISTGSVIGFL